MTEQTVEVDPRSKRPEFLLEMYKQLMNDINRHIVVVWQSMGSLLATAALFTLVEKNVLPLSAAVTVSAIVACWVMAHVYDASYWYNRNLVMIANIERLFLKPSDAKNVHYYFTRHRATGSMILHLRLQQLLAGSIMLAMIVFNSKDMRNMSDLLEFRNWFPIAVAALGLAVVNAIRRDRRKAYQEFIANSPGIDVSDEGLQFGSGHPVDN